MFYSKIRSLTILAVLTFGLTRAAFARTYQYNQTDLNFVAVPAARETDARESAGASGEKGGTADINIGVGEQTAPGTAPNSGVTTPPPEPEPKGNVEMNWKVEEGEKAEEAPTEAAPGVTRGAGMKGGVSVSAGDVDGLTDEEKQTFLTQVKAHAQVQSGQDLENFAKGILLNDENIEDIDIDEDNTEIRHRARGKLFGFIPVTFTERIELGTAGESSGKVKVRLPWFAFLVKENVTPSEVEEEFGKGGEKWIRGSAWTYADVAEALSSVSNILKTKHDTVKNSINNVR